MARGGWDVDVGRCGITLPLAAYHIVSADGQPGTIGRRAKCSGCEAHLTASYWPRYSLDQRAAGLPWRARYPLVGHTSAALPEHPEGIKLGCRAPRRDKARVPLQVQVRALLHGDQTCEVGQTPNGGESPWSLWKSTVTFIAGWLQGSPAAMPATCGVNQP